MYRREFLSLIGVSTLTTIAANSLACQLSVADTANVMASSKTSNLRPETFLFNDDGKIPNSKYPLLLYRGALYERGLAGAEWLENRFAENNWTNSWRNGIYPFHHYHSTSHEVLGIYNGFATVQLGGENGERVEVKAGDIIIIPAGVGHKNLGSSDDFGVVGAYPDGRSYDLLRGEPGERPDADRNIAAVPLPENDPLQGKTNGLRELWK